jgi:hypothetical protein
VDPVEPAGVPVTTKEENEEDDDTVMDRKYGPRTHGISLRDRKPRNYDHQYDPESFDHTMSHFEAPMGDLFQTEQMSLKRGLKKFGKDGANAVIAELEQLEYRNVLKPTMASNLTYDQKKATLNYLMYLKQKRCGRIKAHGCADGRKQRLYKTKVETSSPTVSTEALFLTALINAHEKREVYTVDIPGGAFMHSDMDELLHMKLDRTMAELLVQVDPEKYSKYVGKDRKGRDVIYVVLAKALYGTVQPALLFWKNLSMFLIDKLGFVMNKYDRCIVNKTIDGKQCTILRHVDDLKMSHVNTKVLEDIVGQLSQKYGKEAPLTVNRKRVHEYLGMSIDYSIPEKVQFIMNDYIENLLDDAPEDMTGNATTPAAHRLFEVNDKAEKLNPTDSDIYHHTTARLLYLSKRARPDLQTAVAFLCTRVKQPSRCRRLEEAWPMYTVPSGIQGHSADVGS